VTDPVARDLSVDPADAALLDEYNQALTAATTPFTIPGHKGRTQLLGPVTAGDVPMYPGLDTIKVTHRRLQIAEQRAADLWGADWCRFSVGGSTHANQTLALAVGAPGDVVVATRAVHRSTLLGFVLAGLDPVWVHPEVDPVSGLPTGLPAERVEQALRDHPGAKAVFVVEPGYVGTRSDVRALAEVSHLAGVPLVVDQAWGAHLGFHPDLPEHALQAGADALITSAHKALPAYTQAAMVFARTQLLDRDRLERAFEATHTTSPAGAILASIDGCRSLLEQHGSALLGTAIELVTEARTRLAEVPGLDVLDGPAHEVDPTKLVVGLAATGATGPAIENDLIARGFPIELADRDTIVAIVTIADTADTVGPFVDALIASVERHRGTPRTVQAPPWLSGGAYAEAAMTPRAAFFAPHERVTAGQAVGRISAELIAPYPPGIPAIVPGEVLTHEVLDALRAAAAAGVRVAYAADPTLQTVQVVAR